MHSVHYNLHNSNGDLMNDLSELLKKRISIIFVLFLIIFITIFIKIGYLQLHNNKASIKELNDSTIRIVYGPSKPRGRIYDRNMNVIVDNIGIYTINYKKESNVSTKDELTIARFLTDNIDIDYSELKVRNLKEYWIANNIEKANKKITDKEYEKYKRRKLKSSDLENLKINRITDKELSIYDEKDKKTAYIYYLMNNGYSYDNKIIKEEATEDEYDFIIKNKEKLKGITVDMSWKRIYPYEDTLRQILGSVSTSKQGIPLDKKATYLNKGYSLNDRVGLSYIEEEYEDYLRGTKDKYEIKNGKKRLVEKGKRGNDLVLSIDINLQVELEKIIKEELIKAKGEANTKYLDNTSVVITNPKTGEIFAMAAKQITKTMDGYNVSDFTTNVITGSNTPGSIVKGASMIVGYRTGALKIGDVFYDKCIKFKNTPQKCSWRSNLGALNDVKALELSSNSYQFQLALKVAGINYYYDMPIKIEKSAIDTYRNTFNEFGLGVKSGIDLPYETEGYKGKKYDAGLLLNFAIGQYDTYSPLQIASYVNTISNNGKRFKLNLVNKILDDENIVYSYEPKLLNQIDVDEIYFLRVKEGFKSVMNSFMGRGYMGDITDSAWKTGTSETFYDSNGDNVVDTETISKAFVGFAPADNPVMSIVTISPHVGAINDGNSYTSSINKRITSRICNIFFEIYK